MANSRKTRKRYNPRKHNDISSDFHIIRYMQTKNSDEDVPQAFIDDYAAVIDLFIDDLRASRLTRVQFMRLNETILFYGYLLAHLRPMTLSSDEQENFLLKLTLSARMDFAADELPEAMEAMAGRMEKIGRFVATGSDLRLLMQFRDELVETLGFVRQRDFMAAYEQAERVLKTCPHRTGRFKSLKKANAV